MTEFELRDHLCHIGRRLYERGFTSGSDGNLSLRLGANAFLCTPTMVCKGFMRPEELCTVDSDGNRLAGSLPRTSEILLHLAIYRARPDIAAVVHCHPPHATAYAVTHRSIPQWVHPEVELFLGPVAVAPYATPGTPALSESVMPFLADCNTIILANHGTVAFATDLEAAWRQTEIIDGYCRVLILARQVGKLNHLTDQQAAELLELKKRLGYPDPRTRKIRAGKRVRLSANADRRRSR